MLIKICSSCNIEKEITEFYFTRGGGPGKTYYNPCKSCYKIKRREYQKNNRPAINAQRLAWIEKNPNKKILYKEKYKETSKESHRKYREKNIGLVREANALRRARKRNATPAWVDRKELKLIYTNCPKNLTVDHIIPLTHPLVCGLHVPWNLQYLTLSENSSKSNKFHV